MIINISNPIALVLLLAATVLLIFFGKESKKSKIPQIVLIVYLVLLILHGIQLLGIPSIERDTVTTLYRCIAIDFAFILITFFAYLWIDDIEAKEIGKKSIDNSLDWFWKNV